MRLLSRIWAWVRGLFRNQETLNYRVLSQDEFLASLDITPETFRRRSANICLASRGATKREKNFARRWM